MAEIELNGATYRLATLNAMTQFHVARRLAPVLTAIGGTEGGSNVFSRVMAAIGEMSDADSEYIIGKCLNDCRKVTSDGTPKIYINGQLAFEDIGALGMMQLTAATIKENLGDFFTGLLSGSILVGD